MQIRVKYLRLNQLLHLFMSLLIADSGSTKTEWISIHDDGTQQQILTPGLNPYFIGDAEMQLIIQDHLLSRIDADHPKKIFFYGSGCSSEASKESVRNAIANSFKEAEINVKTDLLASAIACFGDKEGAACILGTGSNTCIYDGEKIIKQIPSLGFILGDEGSGGYFGKNILNDYYMNRMPADLRMVLDAEQNMDLDYNLTKIYKEAQGNRYVASFAKLLGAQKDHPYIQSLVRKGFEAFADTQLNYFIETRDLGLGFVGSVASYHQEILQEVLEERGYRLEIIVRNPAKRLVDYHLMNR